MLAMAGTAVAPDDHTRSGTNRYSRLHGRTSSVARASGHTRRACHASGRPFAIPPQLLRYGTIRRTPTHRCTTSDRTGRRR